MISFRAVPVRVFPAALVCLCASCASPGPVTDVRRGDVVVVQASSAARLAYERGDYSQAQQLFRRALTRARAINDAGLAADAAYNLAMSEIGLGDLDAAEQLLREAYYDAERASSKTADIQLVRAKVAYLRTRHAQAHALLDEVAASQPGRSVRLQAMILRGQMSCDAGDLDAARSELLAVRELVSDSEPAVSPSTGADLAKLEGTLSRLDGKADAAARLFDHEAELLRIAHRYRDMAHALGRAAEAHLAAGAIALAADRYFLAARSLAGQGDSDAAISFLGLSLGAARDAGDDDARARARILLDEITRDHAP